MSKMDGLRAMREARYAEAAARSKTSAKTSGPDATSPAAAKKAAPKKAAAAAKADDAPPVVAEALCGHRNMSGRTCTRELGHAAKSHRYS